MRFFKLYCAAFVFTVIVLIIGVVSAHFNVPHSDKIIISSIAVIALLMRAVVSTTGEHGKQSPTNRRPR